jgi:type VI secretion system secreted protein VgrG
MVEPFELTCEALGRGAALVAFRMTEGLNEPFRCDLFVSVAVDAVPGHADIVGTAALLSMAGNEQGAAPLPTHGIVASMAVLDETAERALVQLELRPRLWLLGLSLHSRVFTKTSVPDILAAVLDRGNVEHEQRLDGSYPVEEHVCQYKESDLAFVSRLMEHEGITFFFEHREDGHCLVLTDCKSRHTKSRSTPVAYHPVEGGDLGPDLLEAFAERRRLVPRKIRLTDYDYGNPGLAVAGEQRLDDLSGMDVVQHGARAFAPSQAEQLARVRQEQALAFARTFHGRGTAFHLRSGFRFELANHPRPALNGEYLCVRLEHAGNARVRTAEVARLVGVTVESVYQASVVAISADVQFRPELRTAKPRVLGLERARIDGPAESDYAQLDGDGRYRIKPSFDESDRRGERASVRTRMMQPHAGNPEGWHLPLRKDTEVLVAFVHGDPDRPVIAGAVPNAVTPSVVTSSNHTKNIFHSGGDNVVEIEDDDGRQWIDLRCPTKDSRLHLGKPHSPTHHVVAHTHADCRFKIGGDQDIRVGGKLTETVTGTVTETYNTSQTSTVTGPQSTTVIGSVTETYHTGHKTTVSDAVTELYLSGQTTRVTGGDRFELYDTSHKTLVVGGATHGYDQQDTTVSGSSLQTYLGSKSVRTGGATEFTFDSSVTQLFGPTILLSPSSNWTWSAGAGIITPSWNSTFVSLGEINANVNRTGGVTSDIKSSFDLITIKYEACLASAAAIGMKLETTIFSAEAYLAKLTLTGIFLSSSATKVEKASIKKWGQ